MPVNSTSSANAAAAAAAERAREIAEERAREAAEERARQAAERARQAAEKAQQQARAAQQRAQKAQQAAKAAQQHMQEQQRAVQSAKSPAEKQKRTQALTDARTALKRAQASAQRSTQAATDAADRAIAAERKANGAASAACIEAPFKAANRVTDAYGAKNLSAADQRQILGDKSASGPTLALTSADAAQHDAQALSRVNDPAQRAQMLHSFLSQSQDASYQKQLLQAAKPQLTQLSEQIWNDKSGFSTQDRQAALNSLTRQTENLAPAAQQQLAQTFAATLANRGIGSDDNNLGGMLKNSITSGAGASFAVRLASSLQSAGKTSAANDVAKYTADGITEVKKEFEAQSAAFGQKQALLAKATSYQKDLSPADAATLSQATQKKIGYADAQKSFEAASSKLASVLNGAELAAHDPQLDVCRVGAQNETTLSSLASGVMKDVPRLAESRAGSAALANAVEAAGQGRTSFLQTAVNDGEFATSELNKLRSAVISSIGARALLDAQARNFDQGAKPLFNGVAKLGKLFGASDAQMQRFAGTLSTLRGGLSDAKLQSISKQLKGQISGLAGGPKGPAATALRGLGTVLGVASAYQGISNFGSENLNQKVQTITGTLGTTATSAQQLFSATSDFVGQLSQKAGEAIATGAEFAGSIADSLNPALQLVGAVTSVVSGVSEIKNGQYVQGAGDFVTATGNLISGLTEYAAVVPVVGDAVALVGQAGGDALALVGQGIKFVGSLFSSPPDPFAGAKDGLKEGFEQMGLNENLASKLSELHGKSESTFGSYINQVAQKAGMPAPQLLHAMNSWSDDQVAQFLDVARLSFDTDGNNPNRLSNASSVVGSSLANTLESGKRLQKTGADGQPVYDSEAIQRAADWIQSEGLVPQPALHPGAN